MKKQKSFTLIELMVVISIIGLISSIVLVAVNSARGKARKAAGLQFAASVHHALGAEAVGIWDFDDQTDPTSDSSGNGNDGDLVNGPVYRCASVDSDYTPSGKGCSLEFNGASHYVAVNQTQTLSMPITISGWAKLTDFTKTMNTFINTNPHTVLGISLNRTGIGDIYVYIGNGAGWIGVPGIISSSNMVVNKWHHILYTSNAVNSMLYLDGKLVGSVNIVPSGWGSYYIFGSHVYMGEYLKGLIDDVRIYGQALSEAQIKQLYAEGAARHGLLAEE